jgi:hypothetical protein
MIKKKNGPDALTLISDRYFELDRNFNKLLAVCKTEEEKAALKRDYIIARSNYRKSVNLVLDQNDPIISEMLSELETLENKIKKDIENINKASNVLKMLSESVKIASSIIVIALSLG